MDVKHLAVLIFLSILLPTCLSDPRDICPPEDLITPCLCKHHFENGRAMLTCERILQNNVILRALNETSDYGYDYFWLDLSSVQFIPASAFEIKKIVHLIIMDTTMVSLFNEPPKANDLQEFTAYQLRLTRAIQWDLFTNTTNLKNMTIENSPLRDIDEKFVRYAPKSLERVTISNCSISKVHNEAFAGMRDLIEIVMDKGKIKNLERSMFPTPSNIEKFSFEYQSIESLPDNLFNEMPHLQHIWLTGNLLSQISESTFKTPFITIRSFLVNDNPIKCNCSIRWLTLLLDKDRNFWRNLVGRCEEPKNLHGVELNSLTSNDFEHCQTSQNL